MALAPTTTGGRASASAVGAGIHCCSISERYIAFHQTIPLSLLGKERRHIMVILSKHARPIHADAGFQSEIFTPPDAEIEAEWNITYDLAVHGSDGYVQSSYSPFIWPSTSTYPSFRENELCFAAFF